MATTVTGKLNKAATQFQAGESTGFGLRLGVKYYDRETKMDQWCNYEAVVFAKAPAQIQFYQQALVEGAIVEISGDKQRIRQFQGTNGLSLSIEILDAKLGFIGTPGLAAPQGRPQQAAQAPAAPATTALQRQPNKVINSLRRRRITKRHSSQCNSQCTIKHHNNRLITKRHNKVIINSHNSSRNKVDSNHSAAQLSHQSILMMIFRFNVT